MAYASRSVDPYPEKGVAYSLTCMHGYGTLSMQYVCARSLVPTGRVWKCSFVVARRRMISEVAEKGHSECRVLGRVVHFDYLLVATMTACVNRSGVIFHSVASGGAGAATWVPAPTPCASASKCQCVTLSSTGSWPWLVGFGPFGKTGEPRWMASCSTYYVAPLPILEACRHDQHIVASVGPRSPNIQRA
jgi:hypothetical protein